MENDKMLLGVEHYMETIMKEGQDWHTLHWRVARVVFGVNQIYAYDACKSCLFHVAFQLKKLSISSCGYLKMVGVLPCEINTS